MTITERSLTYIGNYVAMQIICWILKQSSTREDAAFYCASSECVLSSELSSVSRVKILSYQKNWLSKYQYYLLHIKMFATCCHQNLHCSYSKLIVFSHSGCLLKSLDLACLVFLSDCCKQTPSKVTKQQKSSNDVENWTLHRLHGCFGFEEGTVCS